MTDLKKAEKRWWTVYYNRSVCLFFLRRSNFHSSYGLRHYHGFSWFTRITTFFLIFYLNNNNNRGSPSTIEKQTRRKWKDEDGWVKAELDSFSFAVTVNTWSGWDWVDKSAVGESPSPYPSVLRAWTDLQTVEKLVLDFTLMMKWCS